MEIDWCVSLDHGDFRLIEELEIAVAAAETCDGSDYRFRIESILLEGSRCAGGGERGTRPVDRRRFDLLSESEVDPLWLGIGRRLKDGLMHDAAFAVAVLERSDWVYRGRGANDPEGWYQQLR